MPTRKQHIDWARQNERLYFDHLSSFELTGSIVHLVDAAMMAYGAEINWLDADNDVMADRANIWRRQVRRRIALHCGTPIAQRW